MGALEGSWGYGVDDAWELEVKAVVLAEEMIKDRMCIMIMKEDGS
jgi:hypothetical protein